MLTPAQRAAVIEMSGEPPPSPTTDSDVWYDFLSSLYKSGRTLKDLKLTQAQRPEIMACLRRAPSVAPRGSGKRGERPV
jgi:hypothetical protein